MGGSKRERAKGESRIEAKDDSAAAAVAGAGVGVEAGTEGGREGTEKAVDVEKLEGDVAGRAALAGAARGENVRVRAPAPPAPHTHLLTAPPLLPPPRARPLASPASTSGAADRTQWSVVVYHGGEARKDFSGPLAASSCMSCDLDTSMQMGLTGDGEGGLPAEASLIYEDAHMRYWHDAKGRPLFVVTPQRHVHNLKELTAAEMHRLWSGAVQILTDMGCDPKEDMRDMILNAGLDRNHAHLHLKVRVTGRGFDRARAKWSQRRNRLVDALKAFARKQDC